MELRQDADSSAYRLPLPDRVTRAEGHEREELVELDGRICGHRGKGGVTIRPFDNGRSPRRRSVAELIDNPAAPPWRCVRHPDERRLEGASNPCDRSGPRLQARRRLRCLWLSHEMVACAPRDNS